MKRSARLPLLPDHTAGGPVAWWKGQGIDRETFLSHVVNTAETLPPRSYAFNLCEDRYHFAVGFAAALLRGQTNLLPPSRVAGACEEIAVDYPDSYCLIDGPLPGLKLERQMLALADEPALTDARNPRIGVDDVAAIAFTSGSTGASRPNPKPWHSLVTGARLAQRRFQIEPGVTLVATVPPQHMYGLETTVLLPLISGACMHAGRPFFPVDIRDALAEVASPRVLITTPVHLRACIEAELDWPEVAFVISATAPLPPALAEGTERQWRTRVLEIYGFSEAGSIASRRTLDGERWRLYDTLAMEMRGDALYVGGGHVPRPVPLSDSVERFSDSTFKLLGRNSDMVNIAGKRASLADLNSKLNDIEGVEDGVFLAPPDSDSAVERLAAVVVAPRMSKRELIAALARRLDPAFLPRPLTKVDALPRNETGKLPRTELLALLKGDGPAR